MSAQKRRRGAEEEDVMDEDMEAASHDDAYESAEEGPTSKAPRHDPPSEGESDQEEDDERDILAMEDCGKVKMIECTNFMCHRRLQVKLGPTINIITGQNGSGKSAIVAALQICLGLNARSTKRGQQLSSLIRHGSNADAVVAVELINKGPVAYHKDRYGSTIRIERTLKSSGASSFRILNGDTRKCVSTRRGTVDDIVNRFNIFVDNPSCILDQETSKTFLRGSFKDKYKVFMRATNLEALRNLFAKEEVDRRHAKHALEERKQNAAILQEKVEEAKTEVEKAESLRNSEDLLERAKKEKVWVTARDFRVKADTAETEYQAILAKAKAKEEKVAGLQAKVDEAATAYETFRAMVEQKQQDLTSHDDGMKRITQQLEQIKARSREISKTLKTKRGVIAELERDHAIKERERQNLSRDAQTRNDAQLRKAEQLQRKIDAKRKEKDDLEVQISTARQNAQSQEYDEDAGQDHLDDKQSQLREKEREHNQLSANLAKLKASAQDPTMAFGQDLPAVLKVIERNANRFSRKPIHIGLGCKLTDQRWRIPVEHHLKNILKHFVVYSTADYNTLRTICTQAHVPCPAAVITKYADKRYEIPEQRRFRSDIDGVVSLEDVLQIEDPNVYNAVVDNAQIESCGLCEQESLATSVAFDRRPPGLKRLFDTKANSYQLRASGSHYKQSGPRNRNWPPFFVNDTREFQRSTSEELKRVDVDLRRLKHEVAEATRNIENRKAHNEKLQSDQRRCRAAVVALESQIEELNRQLDVAQSEVTNDDAISIKRDSLTQQMQSIREDITEVKEEIRRLEEDEETVTNEYEPLQKALEEQQRARVLKVEGLEEANETLHKLHGSSESDITTLTRARHSLEKTQSLLPAKEEERENFANMAQQAHEGALKFSGGEEIDVGDKTKQQVETDIKHYEKSLEEDRQNLSSQYGTEPLEAIIAHLRGKLNRVTKDKDMERRKILMHKEILEKFHDGRELRVDNADDMREVYECKLKKLFEINLSYRQHTGSVDIDHKKKTLEFTWSKTLDSQQSQHEAKDAGQLSGGESSFTSLAFLMALGQVMGSPWCVMDEFDVFMDQDNRKLSLELIVNSARDKVKFLGKKSCQIILITPHDVSSVDEGSDLHKIRMRPPESEFGRAQQTTLT